VEGSIDSPRVSPPHGGSCRENGQGDAQDGHQEQLFHLVVEAAPNAMIMVEQRGRIALVNTAAERLFGYERRELLGQPIEVLLPLRVRAGHESSRSHYLDMGAPLARPMGAGRDLFAIRKDGVEVPVEIGLNPILTPNGRCVLASVIDITERKRVEDELKAGQQAVSEHLRELEKALAEKTVLLQEVHHRVKNNLQIISSLLRMQGETVRHDAVTSALKESQARVLSMALVHERLYSGAQVDQLDFGDYSKALVAELFRSFADRSGRIVGRVNCSKILLSIHQAIPCGLILNELVTNALKYAYPGERKGDIVVDLEYSGPSTVGLSVSDQGAGLPDNFTWSRSKSLGLPIVEILARQLGGCLSVQSGDSTVFKVEFPV
jgi:PAS domain S-box-containing protein